MKIGLFTPTYPGLTQEGGIGTYTCNLAHVLVLKGHEVHVLTPGSGDLLINDRGISVHLYSPRYCPLLERALPGFGAAWHTCLSMFGLVRRFSLDVIEFPNWEGWGLLFCALRIRPTIVRLSTSSLETQLIDGGIRSRQTQWDVWREHRLTRIATKIATHSAAHRTRMAQEIGFDERRVRLIPHGIPTQPSFHRPERAHNHPTVVYLGRMEKRKGTIDLIHAVPQVVREIPNAQFVFIGSDRPHCPGNRTHAQYIRDELSSEVRRRITLTGRLPDNEVDHWLQTADVFVAPSHYESFGLIFLEAMRWGTPVIGTTAGGIPEVVEHDKSGLLVQPGNSDELARALLTLLRNEGLRRQLGQAGRLRAETCFSIERMAERTLDLYSECIEARR